MDGIRQFNEQQLAQAERTGMISDAMRDGRQHIISHAIDNLPPEIPKDRDDAIAVEAEKSGDGYRVHVVIADVAAHIKPGSPLEQAVRDVSASLYFKDDYYGMIPNDLTERLSLEHSQERLGIDIVMELDNEFCLTHSYLQKVVTTPDNCDLSMANARMKEGGDMQMIQHVAQGLKQAGEAAKAWKKDLKTTNAQQPENQFIDSAEVNGAFALLCNQAVSKLMHDARVPFIFRNFDATHTNNQGDYRAWYGTEATNHRHVSSDRPYSHVTSPLRRAPDFFNQHQMHYVIDVIQAVAETLDEPHAEDWLWRDAATLFTETQNGQGPQALMTICQKHGYVISDALASEAIQAGYAVAMPYRKGELDSRSRAINRMSDLQDIQRQITKVTTVAQARYKMMGHREFSAHLRHAAELTRHEQTKEQLVAKDGLFDEAIQRLHAGKLNLASDGFSIMIAADHTHDTRWLPLKHACADSLKRDNAAISQIYMTLEEQGLPYGGTVREEHCSLPVEQQGENVVAAIAMVRKKKQALAPGDYSIGLSAKAAITHARYALIEQFAFNELQPMSQPRMPNQLYAKLNDRSKSREDVLREMIDPYDATVRFVQIPNAVKDNTRVNCIVSGGRFEQPIMTTATADHPQHAIHKAAQRMLNKGAFKEVVKYELPLSLYEQLHTQTMLEEQLDKKGWEMELTTSFANNTHLAHAVIHVGEGKQMRFTEQQSGRDEAIRMVCHKALEHFGWAKNIDGPYNNVNNAHRDGPPILATEQLPESGLAAE